jgi:ABC-type multidrug transport system fused ATPase/permease subunit
VHFTYPSNPEKAIFEGVSMRFLRNKFNAIAGQILIDGVEIGQLSPGFILNRVGYVGQ